MELVVKGNKCNQRKGRYHRGKLGTKEALHGILYHPRVTHYSVFLRRCKRRRYEEVMEMQG